MADDIRLVISVEQGSLLKAITNTESLEKRVKKLSDTYARGGVSYGRYNRGIEQLAKATKKSKDELLSHGTAIRANAKAVEAAAIAEKQRLKVLREEKIALDQKNKAEAANSAELKRFRISTDQVYAAEQKLLRLKKMLRAEVDAGNMSMRQAAAVQMQYKRSLTAMGGGMQQTARKTNQLGVMMQQTGYQVGDFAVQVGSGQNVMVAFGQQATQLVGTMAMFAKTTKMIALLSGLGILIPVISGIAAAFMRSGAAAKEAKESYDDLSTALSKIKKIDLSRFGKEFLSIAKSVNAEFQDILRVIERVALRDLKKSLSKPLVDLEASLIRYQTKLSLTSQIGGSAPDFDVLGLKDQSKAYFLAVQLKTLTGETKEELQGQVQAIAEALWLRGVQSDQVDKILSDLASEIGLLDDVNSAKDKAVEGEKDRRDHLEKIRHLMAVIHTESQTALEAETKKQLATVARIKQAYIALGLSKIQLEQAVARETALALAGSVDEQMTRANEFFSVATVEQEKLNKAAEELGTRLGLSFGAALDFIRQAKAEAEVSLDAFGGAGDFKYSTASTFNPEVKTGGGSKADKLGDLNKQLELERELLYLSEAQKRVINALGEDRGKYSAETIRGLVAEVEAIDKVNKKLEEQKSLSDKVSSSMSDAFMSIADGTTSASDAFRTMAADIIRELYKVLVVQKLVASLTSIIGGGSGGGMFGNFTNVSANGNVFSGGSQVKAYANGGVVGRPTVFPMANGGVGLMGEAGPEAIMPLKRGANGKLGVQAEGGSGSGGVVIHQNFNFAANGDESVKKIIAQAAPHIANMTQKQIMDSRRRGGAMKATFS